MNLSSVSTSLNNLSCSTEAHESYRLYVSAEPAATRDSHIIPQGILESSIKITNEPPTGRFCHNLNVCVPIDVYLCAFCLGDKFECGVPLK